jgi:hypothetical protein
MTDAELEAERVALLEEAEALGKERDRLCFTPVDRPDHSLHRSRLHMHHERVRTYLRDRQQTISNKQETPSAK